MKVSSCSADADLADYTKPKTLTWDEIKFIEGIYRPVWRASGLTLNGRIIVLSYDGEVSQFYINGSREELQTCTAIKEAKFVRCYDEKVCFEIKKI